MKKKLPYLFAFIAGVAAVFAIFALVGLEEILAVLDDIGVRGFLVFFANSAAILLLQTIGWKILLTTTGHHVPFVHAARGMLVGFAFNFLTPSMYLGGEPFRTYYVGTLCNYPKRRILATVIVHKFAELTGFLFLIFMTTAAVLLKFEIAEWLRTVLISANAFFCFLYLVLLDSFLEDRQLSVKLCLGIARWRIYPRFFRHLAERAKDMEDLIHDYFSVHWKAFLLALLFTGGPIVLVYLKPAIFFYFLYKEPRLTYSELSLMFVLTQIVLAFQFTPGGFGLYEGGVVGCYALIEIGAPEAVAFAAFVRFADLILVLLGLFFAVHMGITSASWRMDKEALKDAEKSPRVGSRS